MCFSSSYGLYLYPASEESPKQGYNDTTFFKTDTIQILGLENLPTTNADASTTPKSAIIQESGFINSLLVTSNDGE